MLLLTFTFYVTTSSRIFLFLLGAFWAGLLPVAQGQAPRAASAAVSPLGARVALLGLPVTTGFLQPNVGRWPAQVLFQAPLPAGAAFVEATGLTFAFGDGATNQAHALRMTLDGATPGTPIAGAPLPNKHTADAQGRMQPCLQAATVADVYPGIDLTATPHDDGTLEYGYAIAPYADASRIAQRYVGAPLRQTPRGLEATLSCGTYTESQPHAYQLRRGQRLDVPVQAVLAGQVVHYVFPMGYDKRYVLVIDPTVAFSTFSGGTLPNLGRTSTITADSSVYLAGTIAGPGYPVDTGAFQENFAGGRDVAVFRFSKTGTLQWATYLGGTADEDALSITSNAAGQAVLLGITQSADFPVTANVFDQTYNGNWDFFVSVLTANGRSLRASTFVGGGDDDGLNLGATNMNPGDSARGQIVCDGTGSIYFASTTRSIDFPVKSAFQALLYPTSAQDGVIVKLDGILNSLVYSTYLGGELDDALYGLVLDSRNQAYVCGATNSQFMPLAGPAYQASPQGGIDGYVGAITVSGNNLIRATYFGTRATDALYAIARDRQGNFWLAAQSGDTAATPGTFSQGNGHNVLAHLNAKLSQATARAKVGGGASSSPLFIPTALVVDGCGFVSVSGFTAGPAQVSDSLPTTANALRRTPAPNRDGYVLVLTQDAAAIKYGSYFGSPTANDYTSGTGAFLDQGALAQGFTSGPGLPTTNAAFATTATPKSAALLRLDFNFALFAKADFEISDTATYCAPDTVVFLNKSPRSSGGNRATFRWDFGDGSPVDTHFAPRHFYPNVGKYTVVLVANTPGTCNLTDTFRLVVPIFGPPVVFIGNDTCLCITDSYELDAGIEGTYKWSNGSTERTFSPDSSGTYSVTVTDLHGCVNADTIVLRLQKCLTDSFNVISPNGDGKNDTWGVNGRDLDNFHIIIADRWGAAVFTTDDSNLRWNGKINNTGSTVSPGTYYYIASGKLCSGATKKRKGILFVNY